MPVGNPADVRLDWLCRIEASLHTRHTPRLKQLFKDTLRHWIRQEVEVQWITTVEQDRLDKSHNISCGIVAGTHNGNMNYLQTKITVAQRG